MKSSVLQNLEKPSMIWRLLKRLWQTFREWTWVILLSKILTWIFASIVFRNYRPRQPSRSTIGKKNSSNNLPCSFTLLRNIWPLKLCFCKQSLFSSFSIISRSGGSSVGLMSPPLSSMVESNNCFACFFSLLREKFRSSLDYKMTVDELEEAVADWESQVYIAKFNQNLALNLHEDGIYCH